MPISRNTIGAGFEAINRTLHNEMLAAVNREYAALHGAQNAAVPEAPSPTFTITPGELTLPAWQREADSLLAIHRERHAGEYTDSALVRDAMDTAVRRLAARSQCVVCGSRRSESWYVVVQMHDREGHAINRNFHAPFCSACSSQIREFEDSHICSGCGNWGDARTFRPLPDQDDERSRFCPRCYEQHFFVDPEDGNEYPRTAGVYVDDLGIWVTHNTADLRDYFHAANGHWYSDESEAPAPPILLSYGDRVERHCPMPTERLRNRELMFGLELEMEANRDISQRTLSEALEGPISDKYILKSDGSLDRGVELVTIPMSLDEHRNFGWDDILAPVRGLAHSGKGTSTCGIHIHINKRALSPLTIGKLLVFLNSDDTNDGIVYIAQRASVGYCKKKVKGIAAGLRRNDDRYERLNITQNTCELRIFKGNLRPERILKNVEFAHAAVMFCRHASMRDVGKWSCFMQWLTSRGSDYPLLVQFLSRRIKVGGAALRSIKLPKRVAELTTGED